MEQMYLDNNGSNRCPVCHMGVKNEELRTIPEHLLFPREKSPVLVCPSCYADRPLRFKWYMDELALYLDDQHRWITSLSNKIDADVDSQEMRPGVTYVLKTRTEGVYKIGVSCDSVRKRLSVFGRIAPESTFVHGLLSSFPRTLESELHKKFRWNNSWNPDSTEIVVLSDEAIKWIHGLMRITIHVPIEGSIFENRPGGDKSLSAKIEHRSTIDACDVWLESLR